MNLLIALLVGLAVFVIVLVLLWAALMGDDEDVFPQ